jgi:hypothetical protein
MPGCDFADVIDVMHRVNDPFVFQHLFARIDKKRSRPLSAFGWSRAASL